MTWTDLNEHELLVYVTTWCPDCHRLKRHLDSHGVPYDVVDIDDDASAARRLAALTGRMAIPYVEIDGKHIVRGWHEERPGRWDDSVFLLEAEETLRGDG